MFRIEGEHAYRLDKQVRLCGSAIRINEGLVCLTDRRTFIYRSSEYALAYDEDGVTRLDLFSYDYTSISNALRLSEALEYVFGIDRTI